MTDTADLEIVCPGMLAGVLDVLCIGKGDLRLTVGGDNPYEIDKARRIITEMLKAGYSIFIETDRGLTRVKRFNPKRMSYTIVDLPPEEPAGTTAKAPHRRRAVEKDVPIAGSRATVVGRTAGG